ncbi:MAG: hypothetical protein IH948_07565 [Bacteroidetes bacterium]|nr:hypothetical protein [Bacteroidota bacterium]
MSKISDKDTSNHELMAKYIMVLISQSYTSYYYHLNDKDSISFDGKGGYLSGNADLSPLLLMYNNDHTKFPYNWININKNGAPICKWIIEDNKFYLSEILLHYGSDIFVANKDLLPVAKLISHCYINNQMQLLLDINLSLFFK